MSSDMLDRLIQRQHELWSRMQDIQRAAESENRDWSAEERANWDEANAALDQVSEDIERLNRSARREAERSRERDEREGRREEEYHGDGDGRQRSEEADGQEYREAYSAYMRRGLSEVTVRQRELLMSHQVDLRALGAGAGPAGGFLVPPEVRDELWERIRAFGGMLQYCNTITTETGADLTWPTNDDTNNEGVELAENTQISEQDVTFGQRKLGAILYSSKLVRVPWTLLNDSAFDVEEFLVRKFGERLGRIHARRLLTGTGSGQPLGLIAASRIGAGTDPLIIGATGPTGAAAGIRYDDLIDLEHSVDPAYRNGGNARYGLSDDALKIIRKLKDADGRPMWLPVPAPGFGPTINGYPYFIDATMAAAVPGGIGAVFGDFKAGMLVRLVQGIQNVRLNERYADFLQTGFFAYDRMDARPDDPFALAALRFGPAS